MKNVSVHFKVSVALASCLFFSALSATTLLGQVMFPMQSDYEYLLPADQKCKIFQEQTGLCGLFALYNGYSLMNKIKPITAKPSFVENIGDVLLGRVPQQHHDYLKKFEGFFSQNQHLETIKTERSGNLGYLSKLHLEKIIDTHPEFQKPKNNAFVTALSYLQSCCQKTHSNNSYTLKEVLLQVYRFRANPCKPLLVILCINTYPDKKKHHWIALLFTKDVTWIADSNNHQDNMLVHDPDIHFVDAFFRTMPLPPAPPGETVATEQALNCNPNLSQELIECFAAEPGTVFSKPLTNRM